MSRLKAATHKPKAQSNDLPQDKQRTGTRLAPF
jgi:hypothetical protein